MKNVKHKGKTDGKGATIVTLMIKEVIKSETTTFSESTKRV